MGSRVKTCPAKCVLFDLDGTLYQSPEYNKQPDNEIARFVSEFLNITIDVAQVLLRDGKRKFGTLTRTLENLNIDREFFFGTRNERVFMSGPRSGTEKGIFKYFVAGLNPQVPVLLQEVSHPQPAVESGHICVFHRLRRAVACVPRKCWEGFL